MTVWLAHRALVSMMRQGTEVFPLETGGILLGWRRGDDRIVVDVVGSPEPEVGLRLSMALTILSLEPVDLAAALTGVADGLEGRWFPFGSTISSLRELAPRGEALRQLFEASEHRWTSRVEAMSMQK